MAMAPGHHANHSMENLVHHSHAQGGHMNGHFERADVVHLPQKPCCCSDDDEDYKDSEGRCRICYVGCRQQYLRSYRFHRKQSIPEVMKSSIEKLKAAAWTVIACNGNLPIARHMKKNLLRPDFNDIVIVPAPHLQKALAARRF